MSLHPRWVVLGTATSLTLCIVLMIASVMMTRRHFEETSPPTPFPYHLVDCGQTCLIGMAPDGTLIQVDPQTQRDATLIAVQVPAQYLQVFERTSKSTASGIDYHTIADQLDVDGEADSIEFSRALPYNQMVSLLGTPKDIFYRPGEQQLVTVYSDQIYTATSLSRICELLPDDLWDAPTDVVYINDISVMETLREDVNNIGLNLYGFTLWYGEVNVNIFCGTPTP